MDVSEALVSVTPFPFTIITENILKEKEKRSFHNSEAQSETRAKSWDLNSQSLLGSICLRVRLARSLCN
jgi:hypothetical protein